MPKKSSGIGIFAVSQLRQSGISIPTSVAVRFFLSHMSPALPSYDALPILLLKVTVEFF
jgi:hypothetical protein